MEEMYLVVLRAQSQRMRCVPVACTENRLISTELLQQMLETDVVERMGMPEQPQFLANSGSVVCYLIDGRGGERDLPTNLCGTCLYHTGCPIHGDLIFVLRSADIHDADDIGMTLAESEALCRWLQEQFPFVVRDDAEDIHPE